jgi:hypothetical protein
VARCFAIAGLLSIGEPPRDGNLRSGETADHSSPLRASSSMRPAKPQVSLKSNACVIIKSIKWWRRLVAFLTKNSSRRENSTYVEACDIGWWYSARLPSDMIVVASMTDVDILRQRNLAEKEPWLTCLAQTKGSFLRMRDARITGPITIHAAHSAYAERMFGDNWLAVGDAAASYDRLSSSGIARALHSGIRGAQAVDHFLMSGKTEALTSYQADIYQSFCLYQSQKAHYYGLEQRWPALPFWTRRQRQQS